MKYTPRDYQVEAIEIITKSLKEQDRATAVMACGTGKTLVALWVAEHMQAQFIVVFMPSLMLIKQTIENWTEQTHWPSYSYMAVCCDTKLLDDDIIDIDVKDCCFDVCTSQKQIETFLEDRGRSVKIIFSTYQSSNLLPKDFEFDLGIFDEAHKTAHKDGRTFRYSLYNSNVSIKKRLFFTATPRHYRLNGSKTQLEYSMDNEEIYGPIVYRLDFAQAIKKGIICDYRVLITIIDDQLISESFHNRTIEFKNKKIDMTMAAHAVALKQVFDKYSIKRAVTFQRTIKDTKEFTHTADITGMPGIKLLNINSQMTSEYRTSIMNSFEDSNRAIISNARCLSEGVDIPSIDLIAFLSPKKSKIDIIQAIGRVMRNALGKEYGYILLPLYRKQKIQSLDDIIDSSEYTHILQIINSLREYDTDLHQQIIDRYRDKTTYSERDSKIQFVDTGISYYELKKAITVDILERFVDNWDVKFEEAKKWYEKNKTWSFSIKNKKNNVIHRLAQWCTKQRGYYKLGELSESRIAKLKSIQFVMSIEDFALEEKFKRLQDSIKEYGARKLYKFDHKSDSWLRNQTARINSQRYSTFIDERLITYLKDTPDSYIYLEKDRRHKVRLEYTKQLKEYYKKHGHINVTTRDKKLYSWLDKQTTKTAIPELLDFLVTINHKLLDN